MSKFLRFNFLSYLVLSSFIINVSQAQTLLKDINPGANGSQPGAVIKSGNKIFFRANDQIPTAPDFELWVSDGTTAGTFKIQDINTSGGSFPANLADINGTVYFSANNGSNGNELWKSGSTVNSAQLVMDINPGAAGSEPEQIVYSGSGSLLYFVATTAANGKELWKSEGTSATTSLVRDIVVGTGSSNPSGLTVFNGKVYFAANNGTNGIELWTSDGTTAGTVMLKDINPTGNSSPTGFRVYNNHLYFAATDGSNGIELWRTDGTTSGTIMLKDLNTNSGASSNPSRFTVAGNLLYFTADNGNNGLELWKSDGTSAGTIMIDIFDGVASSSPNFLTAIGDHLYFAATQGGVGNELFRYDGTTLALVSDILPGSGSSGPESITHAYGLIFFSAFTSATGRELWKSDGTSAGTTMVNNLTGTAVSSDPKDLFVLSDKLLYFADNGSIGAELYVYDIPSSPTISVIPNQITDEDVPIFNIPFTINSTSGTAGLTVTASSSNTSVVTNDSLILGGSGINRTLTIRPFLDAFGTAPINVQVCDNSMPSNCVSRTFVVTVNPVDDPPRVSNFSITILEDVIHTFSAAEFTQGYFDPEGVPFDSIRIHTLPLNSKLFLAANDTLQAAQLPRRISRNQIASLRLRPDTNFFGQVSFSWSAKDSGMWSTTTALCIVNITPVNDAPIILNRVQKQGLEDQTLNFTTADFGSASIYYDVENTPLHSIRINSIPSNGSLKYGADTLRANMLPYTILAANISSLTFHPNANWFGNTFFRWRASDGDLLSAIDTVFITVQWVNDPPISSNFSVTTLEDTPYNFTRNLFIANYFDEEGTALQKIQIVTLPANGQLKVGTTVINAGDSINGPLIDQLVFTPNQHWFGTTSFEYKAKDSSSFSTNSALVTINVTAVNDPPIVSTIVKNGQEDVILTFNVNEFKNAYSDNFFGENDTMTAIQINSLPMNGSLRVGGNLISSGQLPFTIPYATINTLTFKGDTNWFGSTYFLWKASDGTDFSLVADSVKINLAPVNDPPIVFNFTNVMSEDTILNIDPKDFTSNFVDVDGDTLIGIVIVTLPANGKLFVNNLEVTTPNYSVSAALIHTVVYQPNANWYGTETFQWNATDGLLNAVSNATISIVVEPVNDAPIVSTITKTVLEDQIFNLLENDFVNAYTDIENDPMVSIRVTALPANGVLRLNNTPLAVGDIINKNVIGNMTFAPNANWFGTTHFRWQARDFSLWSNIDTFKIIVTPVNDAPTVNAPGLQITNEDIAKVIKGIVFADIDAPADSLLQVSLSATNGKINLATTASLNFISGDGTMDSAMVFRGKLSHLNAAVDSILYTPNLDYFGFDEIIVIINDLGQFGIGGELKDTAKIPVQINSVNDTTLITVPDTIQALEFTQANINGITLTDSDNDNGMVKIKLFANHGTISLSGTTALTFISGDGVEDRQMEFYARLEWVVPALNNMKYKSDFGFVGVDHISFDVIDSLNATDILTDNEIITVIVSPRPVSFTANPINQIKCEGSSSMFSVTPSGTIPFNYQWRKNGVDMFGKTDSVLVFANTMETDSAVYTCAVTNPHGTQVSNTAYLLVYDKPEADFTHQTACSNRSTAFGNATTVMGATIIDYEWRMGDGTIYTTQNPTHSYLNTGNFDVRLIVTSNQSCKDTITKQVTVYATPNAAYNTADVCIGNTTQFNNTSTLSQGVIQYHWNFGTGDTSVIMSPSYTYTSIGTYNVSLQVSNDGKCVSTVTHPVKINPNPVANFNVSDKCLGDVNSLNSTSTISSGSLSLLWNLGQGTVTNNNTPSLVYPNHGIYNVELIATSNFGCADTIVKQLTIYPKPIVNYTVQDVCNVNSAVFNNTTTIVAGGASYNWTFGDNNTSGLQNPTHAYVAPGTYQTKLVVTGDFSCKDSISRTIVVHPMPIVSFTANDVCFGKAIEFTNNTSIISGTNNYTWRFGDGTVSNNVSPVKNYATPGNYIVKLIATSSNGCKDSVEQNYRVHPQPLANFSVSNVCAVDSVNLQNTSTVQSGGVHYTWNLGNGITTNDANVNYKYANHGTYTIKLVALADSGCVDSITKTATVHPMPNIQFSTNNVCFGQTVNFANNSSIPFGLVVYSWEFGDNTVTNNFNPTKNYSFPGTYAVQLKGITNNQCQDSLTKVVQVYPQPVANFSSNNVCSYDTVIFFNTSSIQYGGVSYSWDYGDGILFNGPFSSHFYNSHGSYAVKLVATADSGCVDSIIKTVNIYNVAILSATSSNVACNAIPTGSIAINPLGGTLPFQYSIDGGVTYQSSNQFNALSSGNYNLQTVDANNCFSVYASNPYAITQPPQLIANFNTVTPVDCYGNHTGFIDISASGGTSPFFYSINNGVYQSSNQFANLPSQVHSIKVRDAELCDVTIDSLVAQPSTPVAVTASFANILCKGDSSGSITANAIGSVGGYQYSINGGQSFSTSNIFNNVPEGSYIVIVQDQNGCLDSTGVTLVEPATNVHIVISTLTNVACFGEQSGSVSVSGSGGTGAKSYSLDKQNYLGANVFTNLGVGTYTIYAKDFNNCLDSTAFTISQPNQALSIDSIDITGVLCNGGNSGTVKVFANGGTPIYNYRILGKTNYDSLDLISNLSGGTFEVRVRDANNCIKTDTVMIPEPNPIQINTQAVINEKCKGDMSGAVVLGAIGGTAPFMFGNDGIVFNSTDTVKSLAYGNNTMYTRDANNCIQSAIVQIAADNNFPISDFEYSLVGNTVVFINRSSDAVTYAWDFGNSKTSTLKNPTNLYEAYGLYQVTLLSSNICGTDTFVKTVDVNSALSVEQSTENGISVKLYPNPSTSGQFNLLINNVEINTELELKVTNLQGQLISIEKLQLTSGNYVAEYTNQLSAGVYFVELSNQHFKETIRLIISK
jgi:ELWxxDGT repeat protein